MTMRRIIPVILSGGSGTRLWPLSREQYPKQLLSFSGGKTLLQETVCRVDGLADVGSPVIVCNEESRFMVAEQMAQAGRDPLKIILEPEGRNTAPALTLAALAFPWGPSLGKLTNKAKTLGGSSATELGGSPTICGGGRKLQTALVALQSRLGRGGDTGALAHPRRVR